ncbi:MAG: metallopeptidase TldD-related protein [Chloroflexota bacterium]
MTGERSPEAMALAERTLALVGRSAATAEAEVNVTLGTSALTRFANSRIHQNMDGETAEIGVRIALDGRVASASLSGLLDDAALARLVDDAVAAARVAPVDPDWAGLTPPTRVPDLDHWDPATAEAAPADRAARVAAFVAAAEGLEAAGYCETSALTTAFANSAGHAVVGRTTSAVMDGIARTGTSDGAGRGASVRLADLDGGAIGARAASKARAAADPTDLEPGRYEVLLEPQPVADLVSFLGIYGFNGRAVEQGTSFVRVGEAQLDPAITLRDDPADPGQVALGFDVEGTPRYGVDLVRAGVSTSLLHSRRTARRAGGGAVSTGNAYPGAWVPGAIPSATVLAAGDRDDDALLAGVGRGLLVTDVFYTRVLDPRTLVVTGLTRNGVWLVEDGRIVRPVKNLRFTQSYVEALAPGNVRAVGAQQHLVTNGFDVLALVPSLHLGSWHFSGGARG